MNSKPFLLITILIIICSFSIMSAPAKEKGECISGNCWNGSGTFVYLNGNQYTGNFSRGKPHGKGSMYYKKIGKTLKGKWKQGKPDI